MKMEKIELTKLSNDDLIDLRDRIEITLHDRDRELMSKTMTKDQLIRLYEHFGFIVSKGSKFWKITGPSEKYRGQYGLQVGQYVHECHIDTTDMIVLLIVDPEGTSTVVEKFSDIWLIDCINV